MASSGLYNTSQVNVRVFAGTVDDPFWIDLGGAFDTLNTHKAPPVLTPAEDAALQNFASDTVSGYAVNSIAIEVPVSMLTRTGAIEAANSTAATIGVWGSTSRPRLTVRRAPLPASHSHVRPCAHQSPARRAHMWCCADGLLERIRAQAKR